MARLIGLKSRVSYTKRENGTTSLGADDLGKIAGVLNINQDKIGIFLRKMFQK